MKDISRFIGIKYAFNGDTFESADCAGLVKLFYEQHGYNFPHFDKPEYKWWIKRPHAMERYLFKNFNKVKDAKDLTYADICYFLINGEGHVGIYLSYGKILSTFPSTAPQWNNTVLPDHSMILHRDVWEQGFKCGFRRKE